MRGASEYLQNLRRFVRRRQHVKGMCHSMNCGVGRLHMAESIITASAEDVGIPESISSKDHEAVKIIAQQCESLVQ